MDTSAQRIHLYSPPVIYKYVMVLFQLAGQMIDRIHLVDCSLVREPHSLWLLTFAHNGN